MPTYHSELIKGCPMASAIGCEYCSHNKTCTTQVSNERKEDKCSQNDALSEEQ